MEDNVVPQQVVPIPSSALERARERVVGYIAAREKWERWASGFERSVPDASLTTALDQIESRYHAVLAMYFAPKVIGNRRASWGEPPSVTSAGTEVVDVKTTKRGVVVSTLEKDVYLSWRVDYQLVADGDEWLIEDRRVKDDEGKVVRGVF